MGIAEKKQPSKNFKYVMLVMIMLIYIVCYSYAATSLSALMTTIMAELSIDLMQASLIVGALPLGIAIFTFVGGVVADKVSTRIMMCIAIVVCAAAIFMRGANTYSILYASMFILGIGQAFLFPLCSKTIATWFTREDLFRVNGILISAAPIGMILGFNTSLPLHHAFGWQNIYRVLGVLGIVVAIIWVFVARDKKAEDVELNKQLNVDIEKNSVLQNLKAVLVQKQAWMLVLSESFYNGMIQTMVSLATTVIATFNGVTPELAALASSMGNLGSLFGYYILPPISDRLGLRKPLVAPAMVINAICLVLAFMSGNIYICIVLFFVGYFFNGWSVSGPRTMLMESPGIAGLRAGTAQGFMNTLSRLAAFLFPVIYAAISAVAGLVVGMSVIAAMAVVAAVFILLSKETGIGREAAKKRTAEKKAAKMNK